MRSFKTPGGTELQFIDLKGKAYLSVQNRVVWFREEHKDWSIETEFVHTDDKQSLAKAIIKDPSGRILATAHKSETATGFADHKEKAESGAVGRALAFLGYGTAFALDLEEGDRLADSPVEKKTLPYISTNTVTNLAPQSSSKKEPLFPKDETDIANFLVTFGKYKDKTVAEIMLSDSPQKVLSYCEWLEIDANVKKKGISDNAQDFIHAARAYVEEMEIPKNKELGEKLARLKNSFPQAQALFDPDEPFPEA